MKGLYSAFGLLLLVCVQCTWQVPLQASQDNYSALIEDDLFAEPVETANVKRHSQGTFTSDFSKYQEMKRAQDLVQWLMNAKSSGNLSRRHAEGTYTSDVSSFLQDQAAKEFISWLKSAKARGE